MRSKASNQKLRKFAAESGVTIVECDASVWGGRYGWKSEDFPNCTTNGFKTKADAYIGWAEETFGPKAAQALFHFLNC
jgi:hypothetical protein